MDRLVEDYLKRAEIRVEALTFYYQKKDYPDVVREAQEAVELALKALLRFIGVDVPKVHDISRFLLEYKDRLPPEIQFNLREIRRISKELRKEREISFYGAEDFIPLEEYTAEEAEEAIEKAKFVVFLVKQAILGGQND
ncbi:HEPN domain-containing protein [Thermococcus sp.]